MDKAHIIFLFVALVIITVPAITLIRHHTDINNATLSLKPTDSPSASPIIISSASPSPSSSANSITIQFADTPSPTPQPTATPHSTSAPNSDWHYPNSSGGDTATSTDSPDAITNWYKDKIRSLGLNTTTFVTTNSNNNILNKLAAAGKGQSIAVEIRKNSSDSVTTITISH